jgi:hypothetical protein
MLGFETSKTDMYPRLYPLFPYDTNTKTFLTRGQSSHRGLVRAKSVQLKSEPCSEVRVGSRPWRSPLEAL